MNYQNTKNEKYNKNLIAIYTELIAVFPKETIKNFWHWTANRIISKPRNDTCSAEKRKALKRSVGNVSCILKY